MAQSVYISISLTIMMQCHGLLKGHNKVIYNYNLKDRNQIFIFLISYQCMCGFICPPNHANKREKSSIIKPIII